ncbi:nucleotidyltransferase [Bacillus velezensis]|uniref:nucleotidyltransferase domain-containing protein n=1 Tax=Bacillus velezensis TaxID=492670 RepID=UPI0019D39E16|nr:nucleotidyltransferase [Bacillus velezensis]MBN7743413.1 nucleotidyltransferase [Bacillus velezensis]
MVLCKTQFNQFHDAIKLKEENATLKEKRDIIINKIKEKLPDEASYGFTIFNQGSYAMNTGIKPLDDDYDIDVGLYFDMSKEDVEPVAAKQWIYDALKGHTDDIKIKVPCVTVNYQAGYHVDVTVYAANNDNDKVYLAKGKPESLGENKCWDESNPKDLIKEVREHLEDKEDRKQFRRVVRYLKRWKDVKFNAGGGKPTGIALTSCVYHWLTIQKDVDPFDKTRTYRDLDALINIVSQMLMMFVDEFVEVDGEPKLVPRLKVNLPVEPKSELFEKMTYNQMVTFKERLEVFLKKLQEARDHSDPTDAAEILRTQFGDDFPVPPKSTTGKRAYVAPVIPSSESALN